MKLLFRIFLSLCFLLTGGYSYIYAFNAQDHVRNTPTDKVSVAHYNAPQLVFSPTLPLAESLHDKMECKDSETEDEDEEDEEVSHPVKKANNYLTSLFYILATEDHGKQITTGFRGVSDTAPILVFIIFIVQGQVAFS
jgi:hypothetical protein